MEINLPSIIKKALTAIDIETLQRGYRAANVLRNAELQVLRGKRSGRKYRKPFTKRAHYTASAPGEAPAVRTGALRESYSTVVTSKKTAKTYRVTPAIVTNVKYAPMLDEGTPNVKPRPFKDPIIIKALPRVEAIYKEPYNV